MLEIKMNRFRLIAVCIATIIGVGTCQVVPPVFQLSNEPPLAQCIRLDVNGNEIITEYDVCTSFCCGGVVYDNSSNFECCGSISFGSPYNPRYQQCCEWWTGHGMGHVRRFPGERFDCCGSHRINHGTQRCCQGHPDPPEVFQVGRQLCCNSNAVGIPFGVDPAFATCCGETAAFDRRFDSCPCNNGQVLRNVTASMAACCETPEGLQSPYSTSSQFCCAGRVGIEGENFCCAEMELGTIGDEVCCTGKLMPVDPPNRNLTECCLGVPFDPDVAICCNGQVMQIIEGADMCCDGIPFSPSKSICCSNNLWSRETQGTECCGMSAFFPGKGSFCCNDDIFLESEAGGDACCGSGEEIVFYFANDGEFICCGGALSFRMNNDECCGTTPYNSEVSICCDGTIFEQSVGKFAQRAFPMSSQTLFGTSCCQGQAYFDTERTICCDSGPFGPFRTPRCCNQAGYDVEGGMVCCGLAVFGPFRWPACCVDAGYDAFTHTCCGAVILETPNRSNAGQCCGNVAIDRSTQLCCEGENVTIPEDIPRSRAECCNFDVFNNDTHLCCSGVIREKTNGFVTRCCGTESYNTTEFLCCEEMDGSEPTLFNFDFGMDSTACCGPQLYNSTAQFCCDGFLEDVVFENTECCSGRPYNRDESICCEGRLQPIGNVPTRRAECCGPRCMYRGVQRCCNDRIYELNVRSNNTCSDF